MPVDAEGFLEEQRCFRVVVLGPVSRIGDEARTAQKESLVGETGAVELIQDQFAHPSPLSEAVLRNDARPDRKDAEIGIRFQPALEEPQPQLAESSLRTEVEPAPIRVDLVLTEPILPDEVIDAVLVEVHPGRRENADTAGEGLVELRVETALVADDEVIAPLGSQAVEPGHAVHQGSAEALFIAEIRVVAEAELYVVGAPGFLDTLDLDDLLFLLSLFRVILQTVIQTFEVPSSEHGRELTLQVLYL